MSNTILIYSMCIFGYPWPCLADGEGIKGSDRGACIVAISIGSTYTGNIYIHSTYTIDT